MLLAKRAPQGPFDEPIGLNAALEKIAIEARWHASAPAGSGWAAKPEHCHRRPPLAAGWRVGAVGL